MKKIYFFAFIFLALIACSKELLVPSAPKLDLDVKLISASIVDAEESFLGDMPELRSSLDYSGDRVVYRWNPGDVIGALQVNNSLQFIENHQFYLSNESEGAFIHEGTFYSTSQLSENGQYFFYYPYNDNAINSNGELVFNMPAQNHEGSTSLISNLSGRDFMFSLDTIVAEDRQNRLVESEIQQIKFSHATAALEYYINGLSSQTILYCIDLYSDNPIFAKSATLNALLAQSSRGGQVDLLNYSYDNSTNSMPLYFGDNGYTFSSTSETLISSLLIFPTTISTVTVYLHTNKGTYSIPKNFNRNMIANTYTKVNLIALNTIQPTSVWNGTTKLPPPIIDNNIYIYCAAHLAWIAGISNNSISDPRITDNTFNGFTIKLINDIDLGGKNWKPIESFYGVFNGNNKIIKNFTILSANTTSINQGLFAINNGIIKNLYIDSPSLSSKYNYLGAIAGTNSSTGEITQCHITGRGTLMGSSFVGGIVGSNSNPSISFGDCSVDTNIRVSGAGNVGKKCGSPLIN